MRVVVGSDLVRGTPSNHGRLGSPSFWGGMELWGCGSESGDWYPLHGHALHGSDASWGNSYLLFSFCCRHLRVRVVLVCPSSSDDLLLCIILHLLERGVFLAMFLFCFCFCFFPPPPSFFFMAKESNVAKLPPLHYRFLLLAIERGFRVGPQMVASCDGAHTESDLTGSRWD